MSAFPGAGPPAATGETPGDLIPPDDGYRAALHNEVHARPSALLPFPNVVVYVAVLNAGVAREDELQHLRRLPGQENLTLTQLQGNFIRLHVGAQALQWERHSEFTRYTLVIPLEQTVASRWVQPPELIPLLPMHPAWLQQIPGKTIAAIQLAMMHGDLQQPLPLMERARAWMGSDSFVASQLGNGHSWAVTDFQIRGDGFEQMVVFGPPEMTGARAGRISQRLLELETYRLMALRGLPVVKTLAPLLAEAEATLADITTRLESQSALDEDLLQSLIHLAGRTEGATAQHAYRFSATLAYNTLVSQRIHELREKAIPGTQTIGEFMQRRLSPAIATVAATNQRLASLSERIARASALLRTRVDIATEIQNQQLLAKLTRGQELQLALQTTVEGLSIAAISYYVVSLFAYVGKAAKSAGLPVEPEIVTGASVPLVLWIVWQATRRIHARFKS